MQPQSPLDRKKILSSVYLRKGGNGRLAGLFDDIDSGSRQLLQEEVGVLSGSELPIVGFMFSGDRWLLLTTEKLYYAFGGTKLTINNADIEVAGVDLLEMQSSQISKHEINTLELNLIGGSKVVIPFESGAPLFGLWHVLNSIGARNLKRFSRQSLD
jgi:hypothetical protein